MAIPALGRRDKDASFLYRDENTGILFHVIRQPNRNVGLDYRIFIDTKESAPPLVARDLIRKLGLPADTREESCMEGNLFHISLLIVVTNPLELTVAFSGVAQEISKISREVNTVAFQTALLLWHQRLAAASRHGRN